MPKISVIMPTYNKPTYLDLTLTAFALQSISDFEVIVVDDGSSVDNESIIEKYKNVINIKYKYCQKCNRSHARNIGLVMAQGNYIIFNDDDRLPWKTFLEEHVRVMESDSRLVTIGSKKEIYTQYSRGHESEYSEFLKMVDPNMLKEFEESKKQQLCFVKDTDILNSFETIIKKWASRESDDNYSEVYQRYTEKLTGFEYGWAMATTGNMGYCRDQFKDVMFDENYNGWGVEDTDFAYQLALKGAGFVYAKNAISYHQIHPTSEKQWMECNQNLVYFVNKFKCIEVYIFVQTFDWGFNEYGISDANETLRLYRSNPENPMNKEYFRISRLYASNMGRIS